MKMTEMNFALSGFRSESVPNTPNGRLNVKVPLSSYESSLEASGWGSMKAPRHLVRVIFTFLLSEIVFLGVNGTKVLQPEDEIIACTGNQT